MPVGNVVLVQPDPDRWQPDAPAFTLKPVGPLPLESESFFDAILAWPDLPVFLAAALAVVAIAILIFVR